MKDAIAMNVPGIGEVEKDEVYGCYCSGPIKVTLLNGKECRLILEDYEEDENREEFHTAISNFLAATPSALHVAAPHIFQYYLDIAKYYHQSGEQCVHIQSPEAIWQHVYFGREAVFSRRAHDGKIYVSLECNCAWEPEHGLQIVFRDGCNVCKIGPYDGHLTNSDAYADDKLENVVYRGCHLA